MSSLPTSPIRTKPEAVIREERRRCAFCMAPATSLIMANPVSPVCDRHGLKAACIGYRVVRLDNEQTGHEKQD